MLPQPSARVRRRALSTASVIQGYYGLVTVAGPQIHDEPESCQSRSPALQLLRSPALPLREAGALPPPQGPLWLLASELYSAAGPPPVPFLQLARPRPFRE